MSLIVLFGYFAALFIGVLTWSKLRHRNEKIRKDAQRPILRQIEKVESETHDHAMAGR